MKSTTARRGTKTRLITIPVSTVERAKLKAAAKADSMTLAGWLRRLGIKAAEEAMR